MSNEVYEEVELGVQSLIDGAVCFPFWSLQLICNAIDAAHREQGRHMTQMGGCPLAADRTENGETHD